MLYSLSEITSLPVAGLLSTNWFPPFSTASLSAGIQSRLAHRRDLIMYTWSGISTPCDRLAYSKHLTYFLFQTIQSDNQSACDKLVSSLDSQTAGFDSAVETESQLLSSRISATREFTESQSSRLNDRDCDVQRFVSEELRKDIPTGRYFAEFRQIRSWAASWQNQQNICAPRQGIRSTWASIQSDQSLHCALISFCWFCHVLAHFGLSRSGLCLSQTGILLFTFYQNK